MPPGQGGSSAGCRCNADRNAGPRTRRRKAQEDPQRAPQPRISTMQAIEERISARQGARRRHQTRRADFLQVRQAASPGRRRQRLSNASRLRNPFTHEPTDSRRPRCGSTIFRQPAQRLQRASSSPPPATSCFLDLFLNRPAFGRLALLLRPPTLLSRVVLQAIWNLCQRSALHCITHHREESATVEPCHAHKHRPPQD